MKSTFIVSTAISSQKEIFEEEFAKIRKNLEEIDKSTKLTDEEKEKYTEENKEALEQIRYEKRFSFFCSWRKPTFTSKKRDNTKWGLSI